VPLNCPVILISTEKERSTANTGCSGTGGSGPEEEWLAAQAEAIGPNGQPYSGSGNAYYTFS